LVAVSALLTLIAQRSAGAVASISYYPVSTRIANAVIAYVAYIGKMVWPLNLVAFYPYPARIPAWQLAASLAVLAAISVLAVRTARSRPYLIVGWLWYLGTLVPVMGLIQVGAQAMADRYTYVPLIGISVVIAWGVPELAARWRYSKTVIGVAAAVALLAFMAAARQQVSYWADSCGYFEETIKQCEEGCRPDGRGCMEDVVEEGIPPAPDGPRRLVQYYRPGYGDVVFDENVADGAKSLARELQGKFENLVIIGIGGSGHQCVPI